MVFSPGVSLKGLCDRDFAIIFRSILCLNHNLVPLFIRKNAAVKLRGRYQMKFIRES